jgi:hypothetical protein
MSAAPPRTDTGCVGQDDPPQEPEALGRARDELAQLRRLFEQARDGASPEWIAAAESAIARAERSVREAGGDPSEQDEPGKGPDDQMGASRRTGRTADSSG